MEKFVETVIRESKAKNFQKIRGYLSKSGRKQGED